MASAEIVEDVKVGGLENGKSCEQSPVSEVDAVGLDVESARVLLRQRWELASVINFLNVFKPVIGGDVKMSAEEIEMGLISPDKALGKLHVTLLKGIPPTSKNLNDSDAWVTVLCKKLNEWWPWVAEGDLPLSPSNGEEIHKYKELDPNTRLLILKALCELRADQDDAVFYINDALKNGTEVSFFRKDSIGQDARGATYWCDKDAANGFRLYKEVMKKDTKKKLKANGVLNKPNISLQWETLATNLHEFRQIVDEFSSSKSPFEVSIGRTIENDALSALEKLEKRKELALKKQQREATLTNNYRNSSVIGTTRSCRNRRPATYTFEDYDKAIDEAIQITRKRKTINETRDGVRQSDDDLGDGGGSNGSRSSDTDSLSENDAADQNHKSESNTNNMERSDKHTESDETDEDYDGSEDADQGINDNKSSHIEKIDSIEVKMVPSQKQQNGFPYKHFGSRWSNRLANTNVHLVSQPMKASTRRMLRQRPVGNRVLDSVVRDSEDESMSDNENSILGGENQPLSVNDLSKDCAG
ncbi:unnamed protein product [Rhodiola kirilowii]